MLIGDENCDRNEAGIWCLLGGGNWTVAMMGGKRGRNVRLFI